MPKSLVMCRKEKKVIDVLWLNIRNEESIMEYSFKYLNIDNKRVIGTFLSRTLTNSHSLSRHIYCFKFNIGIQRYSKIKIFFVIVLKLM